MRIQQGYSKGTAGVQSGYSRGTVRTSRGTVVVGGGGGRIYRESIKITQKLVYVFYIYCNIEPRTSTTQIVHYEIISSALDAFEYTISSF